MDQVVRHALRQVALVNQEVELATELLNTFDRATLIRMSHHIAETVFKQALTVEDVWACERLLDEIKSRARVKALIKKYEPEPVKAKRPRRRVWAQAEENAEHARR